MLGSFMRKKQEAPYTTVELVHLYEDSKNPSKDSSWDSSWESRLESRWDKHSFSNSDSSCV